MKRLMYFFLVSLLLLAGIGIAEAATNVVTVNLKDGGGNFITSGASLSFADNHGWHNATNNNNGTFTANVDGGTIQYKMSYHNGFQTINESAVSNTVNFTTTTTTLSLKDSDGNPLGGGTIAYAQNGWSGSNTANSAVELLPGTYTFKASYHNGEKTINGEVISGTSDEVSFTTTTTTLSLKDSDGNPLSGGTIAYAQNGWSGNNTVNTDVELLPGTYTFKASYHNGEKTINGEVISGPSDEVLFTTVTTTLSLKDGLGNTLSGGTIAYAQNGWSGSNTANTDVELLPGTYTFKASYHNGEKTINGEVISGSSDEALFTTTTVTPRLINCDNNTVSGGTIAYAQNGWSGSNTPNTAVELLPGTYTFKADYNHGSQTMNGVVIGTSAQNVDFSLTQINYVYGGTVSFAQNGWGTYSQGMYLLPGNYIFKFGTQQFNNFAVSGCSMDGNVNIFKTVKHDGSPLPNVAIERNYSYIYYSPVGTTDANGLLFTTNQPNGTWKYKAIKDYSIQTIISGPNTITFQTSEFVTHVKHTDGSPFAGVKTEYNYSYIYYMNVGNTDANGNVSIELFPGDYKFKATKDYSTQVKNLEITTPGTSTSVNFQTSTFVTHVMKHDGSPFEGVKTEYNYSYIYYMNVGNTDASGNASIELFPGNYKFKATKDYSTQTKMLEIPTSGTTTSVDFQTALAEAHVKDCELNTNIAGAKVEYNYSYIYYMNLTSGVTDANGVSSMELFPGTYNFKATLLYTTKVLNVTIAGPVTTFEFNPTRVTFNYPGTVQFNYSYIYYTPIGANTYLFPGTYNFRFYNGNTLATQQSIAISGCSMNQALIFVQLKNSNNVGLSGSDFKYRFGWGGYTTLGNDATGNGFWGFVNGNPTNTKVTVSYGGASVEKEQNIKVNPQFIFNTVDVTADLRNSGAGLLTASTWEYRYGWGGYTAFTNAGHELLPVNTKIRVGYKGALVEKEQNVGTNSHFDFATKNVTADLYDSDNGLLTANDWKYRYGWGSYTAMNNTGEELLPVAVKVTVGYKGASVEKEQNVGTSPAYTFNTKKVTADLYDSDNGLLTANDWKYRYGWGSYTAMNNTGEELLPVAVKVTVGYKGASVEKEQNVGTSPAYTFNTKKVTANLYDSDNGLLTADDWKYRYGWGSYSTLANGGEELLPVAVKVKTYYKGACVEKEQNVNTNANYNFNTVKVTAELKDGSNNTLTASLWQYRYGWGSYSNLNNGGEELLPVAVKVKATYNSLTKEKEQNVSSSPNYLFTYNGSSIYKSANEYDFTTEKVRVYPNPSDGKFMIENVANYFRLSVYDMTGRVVYQSDINEVNNQNIILDNPVSGAYMIKLEGVGTTVTTPIMIK